MDQLKLERWFFALAMWTMPFTAALKLALDLNFTWINPTLLLAGILLVLMRPPLRPRWPLVILGVALVSAAVGFWQRPDGWYDVLREPLRLGLNLGWFWLGCAVLKQDRDWVLKTWVVSVASELVVGLVFLLDITQLILLPEPVHSYLLIFRTYQTVPIGDVVLRRLCGTFIDSPPFGLFMFSAFVIFSLVCLTSSAKPMIKVGWLLSLVGTLAALSDQIFIALALFAWVVVAVLVREKRGLSWIMIWSFLAFGSSLYAPYRMWAKWQEIPLIEATQNYKGNAGERIFHMRYSLKLIAENPWRIPLGIGPGRYGDYVVDTGKFPNTTTTQATILTWLIEYGILGATVILIWLGFLLQRSWQAYGLLGAGAWSGLVFANLLQGSWTWEAWFLALAFLTVAGSLKKTAQGADDRYF